MKKYKGYYIDHIGFNSKQEIDEFIKAQAVERFRWLCRYFADHPSMEASIICDNQAQHLHDCFDFDWDTIEKIEIDAYADTSKPNAT